MEKILASTKHRVVVNVATGEHYIKGQMRLADAIQKLKNQDLQSVGAVPFLYQGMPEGCPSHAQRPYAFKAYALEQVRAAGAVTLLWCDACIVPIRSLDPLFDRIEQDGVWFSRNGYQNDEWTADSAYRPLFPGLSIESAKELNARIPHVVATTFGVCVWHQTGLAFLREYYRLASETDAFCGPWVGGRGVQHRHDQTAASIIAWQIGAELTDPPNIFAYKGGETADTILVADGAY